MAVLLDKPTTTKYLLATVPHWDSLSSLIQAAGLTLKVFGGRLKLYAGPNIIGSTKLSLNEAIAVAKAKIKPSDVSDVSEGVVDLILQALELCKDQSLLGSDDSQSQFYTDILKQYKGLYSSGNAVDIAIVEPIKPKPSTMSMGFDVFTDSDSLKVASESQDDSKIVDVSDISKLKQKVSGTSQNSIYYSIINLPTLKMAVRIAEDLTVSLRATNTHQGILKSFGFSGAVKYQSVHLKCQSNHDITKLMGAIYAVVHEANIGKLDGNLLPIHEILKL
jgi:hypothetical protein